MNYQNLKLLHVIVFWFLLQNTNVDIIAERKSMYETAIAAAEKAGDGSKARRYRRGLKVISKQLTLFQGRLTSWWVK